jgi:hypothetical protein
MEVKLCYIINEDKGRMGYSRWGMPASLDSVEFSYSYRNRPRANIGNKYNPLHQKSSLVIYVPAQFLMEGLILRFMILFISYKYWHNFLITGSEKNTLVRLTRCTYNGANCIFSCWLYRNQTVAYYRKELLPQHFIGAVNTSCVQTRTKV